MDDMRWWWCADGGMEWQPGRGAVYIRVRGLGLGCVGLGGACRVLSPVSCARP
jgi:hypothetical protein